VVVMAAMAAMAATVAMVAQADLVPQRLFSKAVVRLLLPMILRST
jgi:hypothetical protein